MYDRTNYRVYFIIQATLVIASKLVKNSLHNIVSIVSIVSSTSKFCGNVKRSKRL